MDLYVDNDGIAMTMALVFKWFVLMAMYHLGILTSP